MYFFFYERNVWTRVKENARSAWEEDWMFGECSWNIQYLRDYEILLYVLVGVFFFISISNCLAMLCNDDEAFSSILRWLPENKRSDETRCYVKKKKYFLLSVAIIAAFLRDSRGLWIIFFSMSEILFSLFRFRYLGIIDRGHSEIPRKPRYGSVSGFLLCVRPARNSEKLRYTLLYSQRSSLKVFVPSEEQAFLLFGGYSDSLARRSVRLSFDFRLLRRRSVRLSSILTAARKEERRSTREEERSSFAWVIIKRSRGRDRF